MPNDRVATLKLLGDWAPGHRRVVGAPVRLRAIFNLEGPVPGDRPLPGPVAKAGPSLSNQTLPDLPAGSVASLSNNHIMDYGASGLAATFAALEQKSLVPVGAGADEAAARRAVTITEGGQSIAVLARCEVQFGLARGDAAGTAGLDPSDFREIGRLARLHDSVIVSVHAAAEMFPWPSPARQRLFRSLIDAGANVVYGHHAHVPQGWEFHNNGLILYGLGNYCVDPWKWSGRPNTLWSLSPEISIGPSGIRFRPFVSTVNLDHESISLGEAECHGSHPCMAYFEACNAALSDNRLLESLWQEYAMRIYRETYSEWLWPSGSMLRRARRAGGALFRAVAGTRRMKNDKPSEAQRSFLLRYHCFSCQSHREALETALGVLGGELPDLRSERARRLLDACRQAAFPEQA
jgi:hypothetical protein